MPVLVALFSVLADPVPRGPLSVPALAATPAELPVIDVNVVDTNERSDREWEDVRALVESYVRAFNRYWISHEGERFVTFRLKAIHRRADVLAAPCTARERLSAGDPRWMDGVGSCSDPRVRDPSALTIVLSPPSVSAFPSFGMRVNGRPFVALKPPHLRAFDTWLHEVGHALGGLDHVCSKPRPDGTEWNVMASDVACKKGQPVVTGYFFTDAQTKTVRAKVKAVLATLRKPEPPPPKLPEGVRTFDVHYTVLTELGLEDAAIEQLLVAKTQQLGRAMASERGVLPFVLRYRGFAPPPVAEETTCAAVAKLLAGNPRWIDSYKDCRDPRVRDVTALNVVIHADAASRGGSAWNRPFVMLHARDLDDTDVLARELGRAFGLAATATPGHYTDDEAASLLRRAAELSVIIEESRAKGSDKLAPGEKSEQQLRRAPASED